MIYIGGTCCGWFSTNTDTTVNEIRLLMTDRHSPLDWQLIDMSLDNRIKMIINFDSYNNGYDRGWGSDDNLRNHIENNINKIYSHASSRGISKTELKKLMRVTLDNEADEIYSKEQYAHYGQVFINQIAGRFDCGLGNFNGLREDYYLHICSNVPGFSHLDFHLQKDFETKAQIDDNIGRFKEIATIFGKKISITEACPTSWNIWNGNYSLLHYQLVKSIGIGAEDFCCFIQMDRNAPGSKQMCFIYNGQINPNWNSWKQIIKDNKPAEVEEDMQLDKYYKLGSRGIGVRFIQKVLNEDIEPDPTLVVDGIWGSKTAEIVKEYQEKYGLKVDGIVGSQTMKSMIEEYPWCWNEICYEYSIGVR